MLLTATAAPRRLASSVRLRSNSYGNGRLKALLGDSMRRMASTQSYDVAICGGGVMGSASALHLALERGSGKGIAVIERDSTYARASAPLSAGGIRQQFSIAENVEMSLYGVDFFNRIHELATDEDKTRGDSPDLQWHQTGYLFLAGSESGAQIIRENNAVQRAAGADWIEVLSADGVKERFPWMRTDDLVAASFGIQNEGYFDPWSLLNAMRRKATDLGVTYIEDDVVGLAMNPSGDRIEEVHLAARSGGLIALKTGWVVNAAGAFAASIVNMAGARAIPVFPRKRCVFMFNCAAPDAERICGESPLVINPNGVYFRPEGKGNNFICGVSPPASEDPDCSSNADLDVVDHDLFEETIWPTIYERVESFGDIKVINSWAGFYEYNTFDQNAIIGIHPDVKNLVLVNGFSGHGLQQSPAAGRAVSELIATNGQYKTIDLSCFSVERIFNNRPFFERNIV